MKILFAILISLFTFILPLLAEEKTSLIVYTYDSFNTEWGPGPKIEKAFEEGCNCDLKFVSAGDGAALLAKIRLEGEKTKADVVLGLDSNVLEEARKTKLFLPYSLNIELDLPIQWKDDTFLPFDWGFFAFVFDGSKTKKIPQSFRELVDSDIRLVIQDPRSSTPGLGLLLWIQKIFGSDSKAVWEKMSDNIVTVTPGWSEAYGLFLEGEADGVLSYTTSPAYHIIAEKDFSKKAAIFAEGHLMQIEVAAITAQTSKKKLAKSFMTFLISDKAQSIIPTTNWMYPAKNPKLALPEAFDIKVAKDKAIYLQPKSVPELTSKALQVWKQALRK